jgi:hypothetical protein
MKKIYITALALMLGAGVANAQNTVTGYVYQDSNNNHKKDKSEKGIANVKVTNGLQVVAADGNGKYRLPIWDDAVIAVIKPDGYALPLNEDNQPQFFYVHNPKGSPKLKYAGVAPTGQLPQSVDFALLPSGRTADFRALIFGDPQVLDERELGYLDKGIVSEVVGIKKVTFGLSMGDLVQSDLDLHKPYGKVVGKIGVPWYNVLGNHDMNTDAPVDSLTDESFTAHFGPANYAFEYGKAHFIVIEDSDFPRKDGVKAFRGGFTDSQLKFIENDLNLVDTSKLVVFAVHVPLYNRAPNTFNEESRDRLFRIFEKFPHVLVLSAHSHNQRQDFYGKDFGWRNEKPLYEFNIGATCGNWWSGKVDNSGVADAEMSDGTPKGYAFLNIKGNQFTIDYKVAGQPANYQIKLYHRKVMGDFWWEGSGSIYANFFMGYEKSKVEYRIDDKPWKDMKFVGGADPAFLAKGNEWDLADTLMKGRRPTNAGDCTHLYTAPLPENLGTGQHKIEVRGTDIFGRTFTQTSSYRIENTKW